MFHVMLVLPVLAVFGAMAGLVLGLMFVLLGFAFCAQLIVSLFFGTLHWLVCLPAMLGFVGLAICLLAGLPLSVPVILIFWVLYELLALAGWGLARLLRWLMGRLQH